MRVLISNVIQTKDGVHFQKNALVRAPIRLGEDSFTMGEISKNNLKRMIKAMRAFKLLMKVHEVSHYKAYATSALREANNSGDIVQQVKKKSGIKIEIIDGRKEAEIISNSKISDFIHTQKTFLFVDVGGGSTEFTFINEGKRVCSKSFKIGTVRLLNNTINPSTINEIEKWLKSNIDQNDKVKLFATGGNINKIQTMTGTKTGKPISYLSVKDLLNNVQLHSYKERMIKYNLNPDRADVIIPALKIFILTMESVSSNKMFIPKVGLVDGMVKEIFYEKNGCKLDP